MRLRKADCRGTASMEYGGNDTALARPGESKAASSPPHSTWRVTLILTAALLPSPACGQSPPAAPPTQPAAIPAPITFARGAREVEIRLLFVQGKDFRITGVFKKEATLTAFGRVWSAPTDVFQTSAGAMTTVTVPSVRVPTVFSVVDSGKRVVGEVVVYPDRDVQCDPNLTVYSCGAMTWFSQWAAATGLPVTKVAEAELASASIAPTKETGKSLLILGPGFSRRGLSHAVKLAEDKKVNILVLDAGWFGDVAGLVSVAPPQMLGGLSEIAKQHWPQPLKFSSHRKCWPGIANRWAWIADGNGLPLVEELAQNPFLRPRIVLSYLQWQDQLGRREQADELLVGLLTAAATLEMHKGLGAFTRFGPIEVWMVYPPDKQIEPKGRPVLSSMRSGRYSIVEPKSVSILDLRGTEKLPAELLGECRKIEGSIGPREGRKESDLLILGDDRMLDEWEWLKLDRAKKAINRPGVVWLSDDELPPSKDNQIRLMLKLTELGVPLAPPEQQEKEK